MLGLLAAWAGYNLYTHYVDANRRKSDWMNLVHIGIALHNIHDVEGHFPPGTSSLGNLPVEKSFSWMVAILPYIEQANVYQAIDRTQPWDSPKNKWCADCSMRIYLSPAHSGSALLTSPQGLPLTHYVGVAGVGLEAAELPLGHLQVGIFGYNRQTRLADITDGTSCTLMVVDTGENNGPWIAGGPATVRGLDPARKPYVGRSRQFGRAGVAMALYADGSVHPIAESIDSEVFEALATIHGGEDVPAIYRGTSK
jgi:hypothetical protein